ncbi:hypothetical protein BV25DRAFT_1839740 [Artomyces pyxidatus]|uniref:Uncharacterized protein n=1 Tax=Artomyces pyxidatus TaxID=48021 RepID=A0ACB8SVS3_9AGAM|nr:hypothetical protein BV25DRAFT_1839740 [Artomyces pyxidatus]
MDLDPSLAASFVIDSDFGAELVNVVPSISSEGVAVNLDPSPAASTTEVTERPSESSMDAAAVMVESDVTAEPGNAIPSLPSVGIAIDSRLEPSLAASTAEPPLDPVMNVQHGSQPSSLVYAAGSQLDPSLEAFGDEPGVAAKPATSSLLTAELSKPVTVPLLTLVPPPSAVPVLESRLDTAVIAPAASKEVQPATLFDLFPTKPFQGFRFGSSTSGSDERKSNMVAGPSNVSRHIPEADHTRPTQRHVHFPDELQGQGRAIPNIPPPRGPETAIPVHVELGQANLRPALQQETETPAQYFPSMPPLPSVPGSPQPFSHAQYAPASYHPGTLSAPPPLNLQTGPPHRELRNAPSLPQHQSHGGQPGTPQHPQQLSAPAVPHGSDQPAPLRPLVSVPMDVDVTSRNRLPQTFQPEITDISTREPNAMHIDVEDVKDPVMPKSAQSSLGSYHDSDSSRNPLPQPELESKEPSMHQSAQPSIIVPIEVELTRDNPSASGSAVQQPPTAPQQFLAAQPNQPPTVPWAHHFAYTVPPAPQQLRGHDPLRSVLQQSTYAVPTSLHSQQARSNPAPSDVVSASSMPTPLHPYAAQQPVHTAPPPWEQPRGLPHDSPGSRLQQSPVHTAPPPWEQPRGQAFDSSGSRLQSVPAAPAPLQSQPPPLSASWVAPQPAHTAPPSWEQSHGQAFDSSGSRLQESAQVAPMPPLQSQQAQLEPVPSAPAMPMAPQFDQANSNPQAAQPELAYATSQHMRAHPNEPSGPPQSSAHVPAPLQPAQPNLEPTAQQSSHAPPSPQKTTSQWFASESPLGHHQGSGPSMPPQQQTNGGHLPSESRRTAVESGEAASMDIDEQEAQTQDRPNESTPAPPPPSTGAQVTDPPAGPEQASKPETRVRPEEEATQRQNRHDDSSSAAPQPGAQTTSPPQPPEQKTQPDIVPMDIDDSGGGQTTENVHEPVEARLQMLETGMKTLGKKIDSLMAHNGSDPSAAYGSASNFSPPSTAKSRSPDEDTANPKVPDAQTANSHTTSDPLLRPMTPNPKPSRSTTPNMPKSRSTTPNPGTSKRTRRTVHGFIEGQSAVNPRAEDQVKLQANVRQFALFLMERKDHHSPFPPLPTDEELEAFAKFGAGGPALNPFRVDLLGVQRSVWNRALAVLFAKAFIASGEYGAENDVDTETIVAETFLVHIKSLKGQYNDFIKAQKSGGGKKRTPAQIANGHLSRRKDIWARRLSAALRCGLDYAVEILEVMQQAGMSDDESDHEGGRRGGVRRYAIVNYDWRAPEISIWLRMLDLLQLEGKFREDGSATGGNWPRFRFPSSRSTPGTAIAGLPRNFYNPVWLAKLSADVIAELKMKPVVDLRFSDELRRRAARYIHVESGKVARCAPDQVDLAELEHWLLTGRAFDIPKASLFPSLFAVFGMIQVSIFATTFYEPVVDLELDTSNSRLIIFETELGQYHLFICGGPEKEIFLSIDTSESWKVLRKTDATMTLDIVLVGMSCYRIQLESKKAFDKLCATLAILKGDASYPIPSLMLRQHVVDIVRQWDVRWQEDPQLALSEIGWLTATFALFEGVDETEEKSNPEGEKGHVDTDIWVISRIIEFVIIDAGRILPVPHIYTSPSNLRKMNFVYWLYTFMHPLPFALGLYAFYATAVSSPSSLASTRIPMAATMADYSLTPCCDDLIDIRVAIEDLLTTVAGSELTLRLHLFDELQSILANFQKESVILETIRAKSDSGFDRIYEANAHLGDALSQYSLGSFGRMLCTFQSFSGASFCQSTIRVAAAFTFFTDTVRASIEELYALFDAMHTLDQGVLASRMSVIRLDLATEHRRVLEFKRELLGTFWSLIGGRKKAMALASHREDVINIVRLRHMQVVFYRIALEERLETIEREADEVISLVDSLRSKPFTLVAKRQALFKAVQRLVERMMSLKSRA